MISYENNDMMSCSVLVLSKRGYKAVFEVKYFGLIQSEQFITASLIKKPTFKEQVYCSLGHINGPTK